MRDRDIFANKCYCIITHIVHPDVQGSINTLIDPIDSFCFKIRFRLLLQIDYWLYEEDDIKQYFWLGAGRYTNPDGHYFGGVDIGYYRMLGYYGILFLLITLYFILFNLLNSF